MRREAEGRIEVYSIRPVTQNHPPPHIPPLHHPSLHPFVPPTPVYSLSISVSFIPSFCAFHLPVFSASFSPYNLHPAPTPLPFLLLISYTQFLFIQISPPFHQTIFTSLSPITFESSHYFVGTANEKL